jgi:hypothetical protein
MNTAPNSEMLLRCSKPREMLLSFTLVFLYFTDSLIFLQYVFVDQTEEQSHFFTDSFNGYLPL